MLDTLPENGGRFELTEEGANAWIAAVNDIRLSLGVMLDVGPEGPDRLPADHPLAAHLDVYQWLTVLQEYLVLVLMGARDRDGGRMNSITDVGGISVGHYQRLDPDASLGAGWACGVTVVLTPPGTVGAVDCRGGAPGTRETDLLDPADSVRFVDAVLLAGGSAYGLAAADGVMRWLEEHGRGVAMGGGVVPIVPGAVIFDLPVGGWDCRPTAEFGYAAADEAPCGPLAVGTVGAGVGARAGVLKGGVGTASTTLQSGVTVGAIVVVNSRWRRRRPDHRPAVAGGPDRRVRSDRPAGRAGRRARASCRPA